MIPERERDPRLPAKLYAESSGILNWLIEGCLAWHRTGLGQPALIRMRLRQFTAQFELEHNIKGLLEAVDASLP